MNDWPQAVHPDDRARIEEIWAEFLRSPCDIRLEYRALDEGGAVRYYAEHVVADRKALPDTWAPSATSRTSSKTRTLLEAVISDMPVALLACDADGRITHYNRAAVELYRTRADTSAAAWRTCCSWTA